MFPKDIDIDALKEALEENESEVECIQCNNLYPKEECIKEQYGYLCPRCYQAIRSHTIKEDMETTTRFKMFSNLEPKEEFWHFYYAGGGSSDYKKDFQTTADKIAELLAIKDLEQCSAEELGTITRLILDKDYRNSYKLHREKFLVRACDQNGDVVDQEFFDTKSDALAFRDNINNGNNKSFPNCEAKAYRKEDEKPISDFLKESLTESGVSDYYLKYFEAVRDYAEEDFETGQPFGDDDFNQFSKIMIEQFPELAEEKSEVLWALWDSYFEDLADIQGDKSFNVYDNFKVD